MKPHAAMLAAIALLSASCAGTGNPRTAGHPGAQADIPSPRVHFPTGSDVVAKKDRRGVEKNARWMIDNPGAVVVLEGHCDERGSDRLNMELGDRRARSVKAKLLEEGVGGDRMVMVVSYGKMRPLDPRHTREAWRKNRRVEFIVR
ncbi:MAG: OmpA family protein [Pseudomonadota bacterium]